MVWVPGGTFLMGDDRFYPDERPVRRVSVDGFWMDEHPVTNLEFRRFVRATGHVTVAERAPDPAAYPGADPALLVAGSLVVHATPGPVDLGDPRAWWSWVPGASWRHPLGPGSGLGGLERHPVVHVAYEDAAAYAAWAGKDLPTEAEWERAARGGLEGAVYAWGDEFAPRGRLMANTWRGEFPWRNLAPGGRWGTTPVRTYAPNGYGLFDVTGNVWEWTVDTFTPRHVVPGTRGPDAGARPNLLAPTTSPQVVRVTKGGSHLCAPEYCRRYRPAARSPQSDDSATTHLGFRCAADVGAG
jgi:formylglycine-generating enzyme required for sulfatase activity